MRRSERTAMSGRGHTVSTALTERTIGVIVTATAETGTGKRKRKKIRTDTGAINMLRTKRMTADLGLSTMAATASIDLTVTGPVNETLCMPNGKGKRSCSVWSDDMIRKSTMIWRGTYTFRFRCISSEVAVYRRWALGLKAVFKTNVIMPSSFMRLMYCGCGKCCALVALIHGSSWSSR